MVSTQRTLDESEKYIKETLTNWIDSGEDKKVISLARMVERWSRSKTISDVIKMKEINKNIKAFNLILKRNEKMNLTIDTTIQESLNNALSEYARLVAKHNEFKVKEKLDDEKTNEGIIDII